MTGELIHHGWQTFRSWLQAHWASPGGEAADLRRQQQGRTMTREEVGQPIHDWESRV